MDELCKIQTALREQFCEHLQCHGQFLLSASNTLGVQRDLVIYGLNPGQDAAKDSRHTSNCKIGESIDLLPQQRSLINTQVWLRGNGTAYEMGCAPFQKRTRWLLQSLKQDDALVTNLVFFQTRNATMITDCMFTKCWPTHVTWLSIAQPKVIIAYGYLAADYLRDALGLPNWNEPLESGHGNWKVRGTDGIAKVTGQNVILICMPHLSRYSPSAEKGGKRIWRPKLEEAMEKNNVFRALGL